MSKEKYCDSPSLVRSIVFTLGEENCIIYKNNKISFSAKNVQSLEDFLETRKSLSYTECLSLLYNLEEQNDFLIKNESYSIFCIELRDVLVIDDSKFIFINSKKLASLDSDRNISFFSPFERKRKGFCSPEILALIKLPASVDINTFYFSLGALIVFCISNIIVSESNVNPVEHLILIRGTKLYWTILRLLHIEPKKRRFLYV